MHRLGALYDAINRNDEKALNELRIEMSKDKPELQQLFDLPSTSTRDLNENRLLPTFRNESPVRFPNTARRSVAIQVDQKELLPECGQAVGRGMFFAFFLLF